MHFVDISFDCSILAYKGVKVEGLERRLDVDIEVHRSHKEVVALFVLLDKGGSGGIGDIVIFGITDIHPRLVRNFNACLDNLYGSGLDISIFGILVGLLDTGEGDAVSYCESLLILYIDRVLSVRNDSALLGCCEYDRTLDSDFLVIRKTVDRREVGNARSWFLDDVNSLENFASCLGNYADGSCAVRSGLVRVDGDYILVILGGLGLFAYVEVLEI